MTSSPLESTENIKQAYCLADLQAWLSSLLILCLFFGGLFFAAITLMGSQSVQSVTWCMLHYVPCYGALMLSVGSLMVPVSKSKKSLRVLVLLLLGLCPFLTWSFAMDSNSYMTLCSWGCLLVLLGIINRIYMAMLELGSHFEKSSIKKGIQLSYVCFMYGMMAPVFTLFGVSMIFWLNHRSVPMPNIYSITAVAGTLVIGKRLFLIELFNLFQLTALTGWLCFLVHHASRSIAAMQIRNSIATAQSDMGHISEPAVQPSEAPETVEVSHHERN